MKRRTLQRNHKWFGIIFCIFLLMFCLSGIVLNHRHTYSQVNLPRSCVPGPYEYHNWNMGLMKGTLRLNDTTVLIYGNSGIFIHTPAGIADYSAGIPEWADHRQIRNLVRDSDGTLFAAAQYGLYRLQGGEWQGVPLPLNPEERLADITFKGDTLCLLTRNRLLRAIPPYTRFVPVEVRAPEGFDGKVSTFRAIWLLHCGEMFGLPGKVFVDIVALILSILCITGILVWLYPVRVRRLARRGSSTTAVGRRLRFNFKLHWRLGVWTLVLLLFVVLTGWMLRPPLLIPLAMTKVPGIEGTRTAPSRPWDDKLRSLRANPDGHGLLLVTSDGFYHLDNLGSTPRLLTNAPHVNVMGFNVIEPQPDGEWLLGSLGGMVRWNPRSGVIRDYFTGEQVSGKAGPPFGKMPVAGYSADYERPVIVDYYKGTTLIRQPQEFDSLPISLWSLALEVHTGRIYNLFGLAPLVWIFLAGAAAIWLLISGYMLRPRSKGKKG